MWENRKKCTFEKIDSFKRKFEICCDIYEESYNNNKILNLNLEKELSEAEDGLHFLTESILSSISANKIWLDKLRNDFRRLENKIELQIINKQKSIKE